MLPFQQYIDDARKIVILTGAGVSTDSKIPDFKSFDAELSSKNIKRQDILNTQYLKKNGKSFWEFYNEFFNISDMLKAEPNFTHHWISGLESYKDKEIFVITQNVDGLHQKAGSKNVLEMHGNIHDYFCASCNKHFAFSHIESFLKSESVPTCDCGKIIRPGITLFGDTVEDYLTALRTVRSADLLIVMGSRLQVAPVNKLVEKYLKESTKERKYKNLDKNKFFIIWNNDDTAYDEYAHLKITVPFSDLLH